MEKMGKQWKAEAANFIHQAISKNRFSNFAQKQQLLFVWSPAKPTLTVFNLIAWSPDENAFQIISWL